MLRKQANALEKGINATKCLREGKEVSNVDVSTLEGTFAWIGK